MRIMKQGLSLLLSVCLAVCIFPFMTVPVSAEEADYRWITDREAVDGSDYTDNTVLAEALNSIFDGKANVYYDAGFTKMVNTQLGTSRVPNNGVHMYVGPYGDDRTDVGTSCWIYANGVYYTLFGEATGCGTEGENSQKLNLKATANRGFSYDNFVAWGVRPEPGALIRTQCGHSLIVLGYDEEYITILDGNGNGKGLVSIRVMKWTHQGFRAKYIIQPTQEHFDSLYGTEQDNNSAAEKLSAALDFYMENTIPTRAEAAMKTMGCSFLVCLTLLVSSQSVTARIQPFQLMEKGALPNRLEIATLMPAAAIRPVEAGRRP